VNVQSCDIRFGPACDINLRRLHRHAEQLSVFSSAIRSSKGHSGLVSLPGRPQQQRQDHDLRNGEDKEQSKVVGGEVYG
jgi:hypothetical protein